MIFLALHNHASLPKRSFMRSWQIVTSLMLLLAVFVLSSCTAARVDQFKRFADAAIVYAHAANTLTTEAGNAAIDADSIVLIKTRPNLTAKERGQEIIQHNKLLKERINLLGDIRRHAQLMRSYFVALGALAQTDAPTGIGTAAKGVVSSMGQVSNRIKNAKVGDQAVAAFTGEVVKVSVGQFQRAALEKELNARAKRLEREFDLQQAAMRAISSDMRTDLEAILKRVESTDIVDPFRSPTDQLPKDWSKRRREVLTSHLSLASVDAAGDAAKNLQLSFVALVENRFHSSDLESLINEINAILTQIETIRGSKKTQ